MKPFPQPGAAGASPAGVSTIDISPFVRPYQHEDAAREAVIDAVVNAEQRLGIFYVIGHDVYATQRFPDGWYRKATLIEGFGDVDNTIFKHAGQ